ncbi:hypothetical protein QZH41_009557, partial [Actinostola sp. cb2023]
MNQTQVEQPLPKLCYTQSGHGKAVLRELNEQRKAGKFCDVVLKVDDTEIAAHRAVLSSTLPKLSQSLHSRKDCTVFEIDCLSPEAVEILVEYSYTSCLQVQPDHVFAVLVGAREFGMTDVIRVLEAFVIEKTLPQDWLNVWKFADRYNYNKLSTSVEEFISTNIEALFQKQDFLRLSRLQIELTGRRQEDSNENMSPKTICEKAVQWVHSQLQTEETSVSGLLEQTHIMYLTPEGKLKECTLEDLDGSIVPTDAQKEYIRNNSTEQLSKTDSRNNSDDEGILIIESNNNGKRKISTIPGPFKVIAAIRSSESDFVGYALVNGKIIALSIQMPPNISCQSSTSSESSGYEDWSLIASMSRGRCSVGAAELNGKLYAVGGYDRGACLDTVEVYNPLTNHWMPAARLNSHRGRFELGVVDNKIYAIGGSDGNNDLNSVECYNPSTDTWSLKASMMHCRSSFGTAVIDDQLYAIGGYSGSHNLKSVEKYNPVDDVWQQMTSLICGRDNLCAESLDGKIYAVGGYNGWTYFNTVECYDPEKDMWTLTAPMKTARRGAAAAAIDGCLYVIGGYDGTSFLNSVECYNAANDTWTIVASMNTARHNVGVAVAGGMVYAVGGFNGSAFLKTMEYYDPR